MREVTGEMLTAVKASLCVVANRYTVHTPYIQVSLLSSTAGKGAWSLLQGCHGNKLTRNAGI